jgi:D-alanyl-D-alanine carboxypeptidase/D-alanyl-D-alanine-endopeptidase (penicillin-binding protein 4)
MPTHAVIASRTRVTAALAVLLFAAASLAADLQGRIDLILRSKDAARTQSSVYVMDLRDGTVLAKRHPDRPMIPASNMKLVTTATALAVLGPDFQFSTQLLRQGSDLVVVGDGDPAFGDPQLLKEVGLDQVIGNGTLHADPEKPGLEIEHLLARWVDVVKHAGITSVDTLYVDDRQFDQQRVHPRWPADQLHLWYCAQVAGLNFNDNCLDIYATPTTVGQPPTVTTRPLNAPVDFTNIARSGKRNALWATRQEGTNRITLRGEAKHRLLAPIFVTIDDPPIFFGQTLRDRLRSAGVQVGRVARVDDQADHEGAATLAVVRTPIARVLSRCNKQSQNLFAEALLKRVGRQVTGEPGSWPSGAAASRLFLSRALGPGARDFAIDDGSGLSRDNRVTTRLIARLLAYMNRQPKLRTVYRDSLAVGGEEGTLTRRFGGPDFRNTEILAKTGYIQGVWALSGYMARDDRQIVFSIILNDPNHAVRGGKAIIDRVVKAINAELAAAPARR